MQLLIALVIMLVCDSKAISDFIELVYKANFMRTNKTSFKRCACSLRLLFRAVKTAKVPTACALCLGLILTNKQVSKQVGLIFAACSSSL